MRKHRLYAPFVKKGNRWIRVSYEYSDADGNGKIGEYTAMRKENAIRFYQNWLLAPFLNGINEIRELRPVKD